MNPLARKTGFILLKAAIVAISVWFIFRKVQSRENFDELISLIANSINSTDKKVALLTILGLMAVNWFLETVKWKLLLQYIRPSGWWLSFRSVMSGVTVSALTPNRTGEFAGRILHLDPGIRIKAAFASIIGSMNQLLITIIMGGIGLIASMELFVTDAIIGKVFILLVVVVMCVSVYIYFRIPALTRLAAKVQALRKMSLYTSVFEKYSGVTLIKLSVLSMLRYLVFSYQFILMLHWCDIVIPWQDAMKAITIMYIVMAIVPSIALSELTVRGSVALFFFSFYSGNSTGILAASSMIWIINLVIPALVGALAAFYFRFTK